MRTKQQWREWAKAQRAALPDRSAEVSRRIVELLQRARVEHAMAYRALPQEISPEGAVQSLPQLHWCAPRVDGHDLSVHPYGWATQASKYGILEATQDAPTVDPNVLDAVLVPGLVFDGAGTRVGYGQGFYDRFLWRVRPDCLVVGIAREALLVDALPKDQHDVAVNCLVTEDRIIHLGSLTR